MGYRRGVWGCNPEVMRITTGAVSTEGSFAGVSTPPLLRRWGIPRRPTAQNVYGAPQGA